tara:strand:- start:761 stop:1198 length:438 start_codon:yes stop_codon:yes gene_type:complete
MTTALGSEQWAVIGVVDPDANTAAQYLTAAIDMSLWSRIVAVVQAGTLGSSGTLDFKLTDASASGGSYTDITGKAITQLTQAGTDADKQSIINLRFDELNDDARYVKAAMTVGTATSDCSAIVMGLPRYYPASDNDLSSVDEIVN